MTLVLSMVTVLAIIYIVPLVIYGAASALGGPNLPLQASPAQFLAGVLITKLGTAIAFVLLFDFAASAWGDRWLVYALIWFVMFAASEAGDAVSRRSTWQEAVLGVASEAIYAPVSAFAVYKLLGAG